MNRREKILNECPPGEVDAQKFWDLVQHNDQPDSGSKPNEYRFGDEVCHESQAQEAGQP